MSIDAAEVIDLTLSDSEDDDEVSDSATSATESELEDEEGVIDEETRKQLHVAIACTPEARLREVVALLVDSSPDIEKAAAKHLVTRKRVPLKVIPRYEICDNCDEEFDTSERREDDECCFHPGELECNYEAFEDWDEDCHGPMDTKSNRREFPENFNWSCCDNDGTEPGCVKGRHTADSPNKRQRL
ncbi:hypothetical protein ONZ45_g17208 [Pleurotus djamor]|nr:hypothetical protein ONZ45_g17208 [Pleurotus djamor]